jgi:S1-C subfamily serine protease
MNLHGHPSWDACILITSRNPDNRRFGTGFIIYHSGQKSYVVTCAHVISDVGGEELIEADGQPARIVGIGSDDGLDLAVIEVDESEFPTALTALIRTWYEVPFVKPEIVSGVEVSTGERAVQFEPLFVDH